MAVKCENISDLDATWYVGFLRSLISNIISEFEYSKWKIQKFRNVDGKNGFVL